MITPPQRLSKTGFMQYLHCAKSLWLEQHKPHLLPSTPPDASQQLRRDQGYVVEAAMEKWLSTQSTASKFQTQTVFETSGGAYARTDATRLYPDGAIDLIEVKSGQSVQPHHRYDLAFQACVAEACGQTLKGLYVAHIRRGSHVGDVEPPFVLSDETTSVRALMPDIAQQIPLALEFLAQDEIDESHCTCLALTRGNHCASFDNFNADLPAQSIYMLPNLTKKQIVDFRDQGVQAIADVSLDNLSASQRRVAWSAQNAAPFIDRDYITDFVKALEYPLYFYDYEAYASALPDLPDVPAGAQLPIQFSLHVLEQDGTLRHVEYLAEVWEKPAPLIDALRAAIGPKGSVISWNKGYENGRNTAMAGLYPQHKTFLEGVSERTVDLMDVFKHGYVDSAFQGRTSIKNVLPVMVPELSYAGMAVANGGDAMAAFDRMISMEIGPARDELRRQMLEYCALDSLAMVRLFQAVEVIL